MPKPFSATPVEEEILALQEEFRRWRQFVPAHGASHRFGAEDTSARLPAFIRVRKAADQTIGTGANTKILVDTLDYGPRGPQLIWDSTNNQIDVLETGIYSVSGGTRWANNATGARNVSIFVNGSEVIVGRAYGHASENAFASIAIPIRFAAGDYVELYGWQDSGGDLVCVAGANYPFFSVAYMSPTT